MIDLSALFAINMIWHTISFQRLRPGDASIMYGVSARLTTKDPIEFLALVMWNVRS